MIDLFNKRKVKSLQSQLNYNKNYIEKLNGELAAYKKLYKEKCENENKTIDNLSKENQKLIDWIYKILNEYGQLSTFKNHSVMIPYYKDEEICSFGIDTNEFKHQIKETIVIPELIITKSERIKP